MTNNFESKKKLPTTPKATYTCNESGDLVLKLEAYNKLVKTNKKGKSITKQIPSQALGFVSIDAGEVDFNFQLNKSRDFDKATENQLNKKQASSNADENPNCLDPDCLDPDCLDPDCPDYQILSKEAKKVKKAKKSKEGNNSKKSRMTVKLKISSFEVATTPITQGVWKYVMGFNPSYYRKKVTDESVPNKKVIRIEKDLNRPVESITWFDAIAFCNKLSELEGLDPYYNMTNIKYDDGKFKYRVHEACNESLKKKSRHIVYAQVTRNVDSLGYRLPTVAEHDLISKAERDLKSKRDLDKRTQDLVETLKGKKPKFQTIILYTEPVGKGKPNNLGLYDLNSNIAEMLYDYDVTTSKLRSEMTKLDKNNPYNFLRGSAADQILSRGLSVHSKEDMEFLESLTVLENPTIEPKTQPSIDDFVAHCVNGDTNTQFYENGFYFERDGFKLAGKYTESQFSRSPQVGFRIVKNHI